jgi:hypothetical protein
MRVSRGAGYPKPASRVNTLLPDLGVQPSVHADVLPLSPASPE